MASVSLEMLSQQEKKNKLDENHLKQQSADVIPIENNDNNNENKFMKKLEALYENGCKSYYGIGGTPVNYNIAFSQFMDAAKDGHPASMTMVASCYRLGYGIERNLLISREWLEKAVTAGCPDAMNELAMSLIAQVKYNQNRHCLHLAQSHSILLILVL